MVLYYRTDLRKFVQLPLTGKPIMGVGTGLRRHDRTRQEVDSTFPWLLHAQQI